MSNFIQKFIANGQLGSVSQSVLNRVKTASPGVKQAGLANLLQSMNGVYVQLSNKCQVAAELLPALCFDADIFSDNLQSSSDLVSKTTMECCSVVSSETKDIIFSSINSVVDFSKKTFTQVSNYRGVTLTSAKGYDYEIIQVDTTINDNRIILATTQTPLSIDDALLFQRGDKWYINNRVRSKGYFRNQEEIVYDDIQNNLLSLADWADCDMQANDIRGRLVALVHKIISPEIRTAGMSIRTLLDCICERFEIATGSILTDLQEVNHRYYEMNLGTPYGIVEYLGDIVHDGMINDTINNVLMTAADLLRNGKFSVDTFTGCMQTYLQDTSATVRSVFSAICNSYASGGVYGAIRYILDFISKGNSVALVGDDGAMQFTDNKSLVPAEYIAGIVCTIAGSVATVVGIILSVVGYGIGYALAALGTILFQIPQAINYDYQTATWPTVVCDESKVTLPYYPHAAWQYEIGFSALPRQMQDAINDGVNCFYVTIPGGILIIGPSSASSIDIFQRYRVEFHPAVADFDVSPIFPNVTWKRMYTHTVADSYTIAGPVLNQGMIATEDSISQAWGTATSLDLNIDDSGLVSNESDDKKLRWALLRNTCLAYLWFAVTSRYQFDWYWVGYMLPIYALWTVVPSSSGYDYIATRYKQNITGFTGLNFLAILAAPYDSIVSDSHFNSILLDWNGLGDTFAHWENWELNACCCYVRPADLEQTPSENLLHMNYHLNYSNPALIIQTSLTYGNYLSNICPIPQSFSWMVITPKYNRSTFFTWVFVSIAVTVVAIVATVIATVSIKKFCQRQQAKSAAQVESAWENFKSNPSEANYKAYRKAAFKANLKANIVGGSKYSYTSYWNSSNDSTSTSAILDETRNNIIPGYFDGTYNPDDGLFAQASSKEQVQDVGTLVSEKTTVIENNIDGIVTLITGNNNNN